jgi:hypothetical protein
MTKEQFRITLPLQLPLVLVNGQVLSSGGKISVPAIQRHLEALGLAPIHPA